MQRFLRRVLFIFGAFASWVAVAHAQTCSKTHPYVGYSGPIKTIEVGDGLKGDVTILDDCTFQVANLSLNQGVPKVFWWGDNGDITTGFRVCNTQLSPNGYTGVTMMFKLDNGKSWNDFNVLVGYCEDFKADLAEFPLPKISGVSTVGSVQSSSSNQTITQAQKTTSVQTTVVPTSSVRASVSTSAAPGTSSSIGMIVMVVLTTTFALLLVQ